MKRITILGDGGWGTALALLLHRNGHAPTVWSPFPEYADEVCRTRENVKFLPGHALPVTLNWTSDPEAAAAGAEVVIMAPPSQYYADVARRFRGRLPAAARIVSATKGLDAHTHRRMTEIAEETLGLGPVAALSGPSFAEEVARGLPTAVVIACRDPAVAVALQRVFMGPDFRVYTSDDPVGVELGGALKNVIALAAGVVDGLGLGYNTRAALITRGLAELARLGSAVGAHASTFSGLSGVGDLVLTCTGALSRNRRVGERLGRGEALADILGGMEQVAEGVVNCAAACALARENGVELPIAEAMNKVIHKGLPPKEAVQRLMSRDPRHERD